MNSKDLNVPNAANSLTSRYVNKEFSTNYESAVMGLSKVSVPEQCKFSDMLLNYVVQQVRPNCIIRYSKTEFKKRVEDEQLEQLKLARKNTYKGEISKSAQKTLKKRIECWQQACFAYNRENKITVRRQEKHLVFITLTLPSVQFNSDIYLKEKALKSFLRILREQYGLKNYIWKAESQKNRNIHFHIIIDKYIDKQTIDGNWLEIMTKLGYIKPFFDKYGHVRAPMCRIEMVRDNNKLNSYISKYIAKTDQNRLIDGATWACSKNLQSLTYFEFIESHQDAIDKFIEKDRKDIVVVSKDNYEIIFSKSKNVYELLSVINKKDMHDYYYSMSRYLQSENSDVNFRQFMFDYYFSINKDRFKIPLIAEYNYPSPVQLNLPF